MSRRRRLAMVDRGHPGLSVVKQCRLLQLSRSAVYYRPTPTKPADSSVPYGGVREDCIETDHRVILIIDE